MAETTTDERPSLVLVFDSKSPSKAEPNSDNKKAALDEYDRLLIALRNAGLQTQTFEAEPSSGKLLIFVRPTIQALLKAVELERTNDYLHGVKSSAEAPVTMSRSSSLPSDPLAALPSLTPADRLRFAFDLVTSPPCTDKVKAWHCISGADALPKKGAFPRVVDIAALHDEKVNKAWLKKWTAPSAFFRLGVKEIDNVRNHFGEEVGLYFGFLLYYFNAQMPLAAIGVAFWALGLAYHPVYSVCLVIWACVTVEGWRMRERKLAVRWGCYGVTASEPQRRDFKPRIVRRDTATGESQEIFEWWRRELRMATTVPVVIFFAAILGATMTAIFILEVFIAKIYKGRGEALVPLVPTVLFTTAVPQILAAWQATAAAMTRFENHQTGRAHSASLTLKMFALQAFVAYGALTLSAFVYIPFGQTIMNRLIGAGCLAGSVSNAVQSGDLKYNADGNIQFDVNPSRMHTQLFAASVTSQATNAFTELLLPIILRKIAAWRQSRASGSADKIDSGSTLVQNALSQLRLPTYEVFGDYAEMSTQFGNIVLWSTIWPLTPVIGFVNNFFEVRGDAAKLCVNVRRPIPQRVESVGPWLEVLGFLAWLSAMMNAALLYMFESAKNSSADASAYATVMRQHGGPVRVESVASNGTFGSDPNISIINHLPLDQRTSPQSSALLVAFLLALASEHGYAILRSVTRHVLERAAWRVSPEFAELERRDWQSRRNLLHAHQGRVQPAEAAEKQVGSAFWDQPDQGDSIIQGTKKKE